MQLNGLSSPPTLRGRIGAAACLLLATGAPATGHAQSAAAWQLDASGLIYGEQNRTAVVEPSAKITRLFANGQRLSAELGIDAITGASPSGAMPSGRIQTTTTPSGNVQTSQANQIPTSAFHDLRGALDLEWKAPVARYFTTTLGGHFSREKDYQSRGLNGTVSVDLFQRLWTVTAGGGVLHDDVFPVGGTPVGMLDSTVVATTSWNSKKVTTRMLGVSHVLTRRWLVGVNTTETRESGYLTEPYKIVSLIDPATGYPSGQLTEKRPSSRLRRDVLGSSVYHFDQDILYLSYRYYWDDWGVKSHTLDGRLRVPLQGETFVQPHVRLYTQTQSDFFHFGLADGLSLPAYATSDERLGPLRTVTLGGTYGFHLPHDRGSWTVRAEYMTQWGRGHPADALGVQQNLNLFPPLSIGSVVVGYSIGF